MKGPISELYLACGRRHLKWILPEVKKIDPKVFYILEPARDMSHSHIVKHLNTPMGGWRSRFKKK